MAKENVKDSKTEVVIKSILDLLRKNKVNPKTVRYIFQEVRKRGKYQVPKVSRKLPDFLNDAEIDHLLNKSLEGDQTTSLLCHLGIFTGLRISEMNNLQLEHISFADRQLKVVGGKGGKDRYVPLSNSLMHHIKAYVGDRNSGYLFVKSNETQYTKRALQKKVEIMLKKCHFKKRLSTHSLRHTYATLLRRRGMQLDRIQVLMGHGSRNTTEIYAHIELAPIKEEFIRLVGME